MPTKRRFILFLIVLAFMLLVKYAAAQESVSWATVSVWDGDPTPDLYATMLASIVFGFFAGSIRIFTRNEAARRGHYFTGDLVLLRIAAKGF